MLPAFTWAARSSMPTMSAPAAFASSTFLPAVNTATRRVLPVPCGITVEPRTCWSDFAASMPRFTAQSTVSLNFAVANSFTSFRASSIGYCLPGASFALQVFMRFAIAMALLHHVHAHRTGTASDRAHRGVEIGGRQIRRLRLRDLFELLARDLADLGSVRRAAALLDADRLADQHGRRRRLHDESEAAIRIHRDDHGDRQVLFDLLRGSVELLAEFHDVHALLTERGPDRRCGIGRACRHLQFDVAVYLLRHDYLPPGCKRPDFSPELPMRVPTVAPGLPVRAKTKIFRPFRPAKTRARPGSSGRESARPPAAGSSRSSRSRPRR